MSIITGQNIINSAATTATKPKSKTKPKARQRKPKRVTPEKVQERRKTILLREARKNLLRLGFALDIQTTKSFSEYVNGKKHFRLVAIAVKNKKLKDRWSRHYKINPNYFVVYPMVGKEARVIVRFDSTRKLIVSIAAKSKGIDEKTAGDDEVLFWETVTKLANGNPEILDIARFVKSDHVQHDPLHKWNKLNPKVGGMSLKFVCFDDFRYTSFINPVELNRDVEKNPDTYSPWFKMEWSKGDYSY